MNEILNINNVHGYLDKETGTAYLNAGDVARGFGFTKTETKNGVKYESVRWARVNEYLSSFGFRPNVVEDDFLPENMVYRLGFKASITTCFDCPARNCGGHEVCTAALLEWLNAESDDDIDEK